MATSNFIVDQGLTIGPTSISAVTGDITTTGNITIGGSPIATQAYVTENAGGGGTPSWATVTDKPTTLAGFGLTAEVNTAVAAAAGIDLVRYLSMPGTLTLFTGKARWYPPQSVNILWLQGTIDTSPIGSDINIVLKKNGSTVSGGTVSVVASTNKSSKVTLTGITGTIDDYFTIDVTQIGSSIAGSDLSVAVAYEYQ
jgi:hypothetical protein